MSSRNAYLQPDERRGATVLYRALDAARNSIARGERDALRITAALRDMVRAEPLAELDYAELVDAETFEPVTRLRGACLALLAVQIGAECTTSRTRSTRLIDNLLIEERDGAFVVSL
jgi:pantoate--beta-alanine ligase